MEYVRKGFRRVKNRIANRPSAVQKRYYLKLRAQLDPLRRPSDSGPNRPVLMISGITMRGTGIFCNLLAFLRWVDFAHRNAGDHQHAVYMPRFPASSTP